MREESLSREVRYGKQDIAELESASMQVHQIYKKAAELFKNYVSPRLPKRNLEEGNRLERSDGQEQAPVVLQKWIQTSSGWKCIGCELKYPESMLGKPENEFPHDHFVVNAGERRCVKPELLVQAIVWSQYEKIRMLAPWLGDEAFYTTQELDIIARYIVPTYFSERPLVEQGKHFKVQHQYGQITLYQEYVSAPSFCVQLDGEQLEGRLLTGVYVSEEQVYGLNPYLKNVDGGRTYMQACVQ